MWSPLCPTLIPPLADCRADFVSGAVLFLLDDTLRPFGSLKVT